MCMWRKTQSFCRRNYYQQSQASAGIFKSHSSCISRNRLHMCIKNCKKKKKLGTSGSHVSSGRRRCNFGRVKLLKQEKRDHIQKNGEIRDNFAFNLFLVLATFIVWVCAFMCTLAYAYHGTYV